MSDLYHTFLFVESLNKPVPWRIVKEPNDASKGTILSSEFTFSYSFKINDLPYRVIFDPTVESVDEKNVYLKVEIVFGSPRKPSFKDSFEKDKDVSPVMFNIDQTKTGNEFKVFSTVLDIIKNWIEQKLNKKDYKTNDNKNIIVDKIMFSSEKDEFSGRKEGESRKKLYLRLAQKYTPKNFELKVKENNQRTDFILKRK